MDSVKRYLSNSDANAPFFLVVGDANYDSIKAQCIGFGLVPLRISDFCSSSDKMPNLDNFIRVIKSANEKKLVLGLGEYLALQGEEETKTWLNFLAMEVKARVVLLLRGVTEHVKRLQANDPTRFDARRLLILDNTDSHINITILNKNLTLSDKRGLKQLLIELEDGETKICVKSDIQFSTPLINVNYIKSAYEGILYICPAFPIAETFGSNEQWEEFLNKLSKNGDINKIFSDFENKQPEFEDWFYFIYLKLNLKETSYLKYVVDQQDNFIDFKKNILFAISNISHTDARFDKFFEERKALIDMFSESDVADFLFENRRNIAESIYRLTDKTLSERQEFIALFNSIDKKFLMPYVNNNYPALSDYLCQYTFADVKIDAELNSLFTDYFERYKWQKLFNKIHTDFIEHVEFLAKKRPYNGLRTRTEVIDSIGSENTFLYWIDALGLEFLGFIQKFCERKCLSLKVHIAQANLPTITTINNYFFYDGLFEQSHRHKEERLDDLKHKDKGGYVYKPGSLPIHLAKELDIIEDVLEGARTKLSTRYNRVLIVSDHGASRLAVIHEQEEKYEVDEQSKGKHGGRCMIKPDNYSPTNYDLPFVTESEDGTYLVLANYGRFKGSRAENIEVHGGASLEEVVIPIIEITHANPNIKVELLNSDSLYASFRKNLEFTLFTKLESENVSISIKGKTSRYTAKRTDRNHYHIITDITRSGEYYADVLDDDTIVGKIILNVQSETQKKNEGFDDAF